MTTPQRVAAKLKGTLKKYTIDVYLNDGRHIEYQDDEVPRVTFDTAAREAILFFGYGEQNGVKMAQVAAWRTTPNETQPQEKETDTP